MNHHHHYIYLPQNKISTSIQESRGRLPERHKHPSMLAALTTKRCNTSTQMHKKHKKEEKHSHYTSRQQFMCRRKNLSFTTHSTCENLYLTRKNISGSKTDQINKLTNLTINIKSQHIQHNEVKFIIHYLVYVFCLVFGKYGE